MSLSTNEREKSKPRLAVLRWGFFLTQTPNRGCSLWSKAFKELIVAIFALLIPAAAMAEGECQQDRQRFCKAETKANVGACLEQHVDELSEACKAIRQARALASPASAETSPNSPNAQSGPDMPSAGPKSSPEADQPNGDASDAKPESEPEAAEASAKEALAQAGSQILINID